MSCYFFYGLFIQSLLAGILLASDGKGQNHKSISEIGIALDLKDKKLVNVITKIENQTGLQFVYHDSVVKGLRVSLGSELNTLEKVLISIAQEHRLNFKRINNNISIDKNDDSISTVEEIVEEKEYQQFRVSGKVTSSNGKEPLPGVSILIKGTSTGTTTNMDGEYSLNVTQGDILQFSFIGYETEEIVIENQTTINVTLTEDLEQLEEVVVVGYGTVKKSDLTGSVASVKAEELERQPITTIDQGLQGLAPGVQVQQTSGAPGGAITLRIRGSNSISAGNEPLYVIDGLPVVPGGGGTPVAPSVGGFNGGQTVSPLASISPNDIESIEVLKDASATALYGARASNGVVLITTKRGKSGKAIVSFDSYAGVQELANEVDFMSAEQHRSYLESASSGGSLSIPLNEIPNENIDWFDIVQKDNPIIQSHTLGVQGGNESTRYAISGNYFEQEGILKNSGIERTSLRVNLDIDASERLKIGVSTNTSFTENQVQTQNGVGNYQIGNSPFTWAQWLSPLFSPLNEQGNNAILYFDGTAIGNPQGMVSDNVVNEIRSFRTFGTAYAEYKILDNLKYKINVGIDLNVGKRNAFFPEEHPFGVISQGFGQVSTSFLTNWLIEHIVTYDIEKQDNRLSFLVGATSQKERGESSLISAQRFDVDALSFNRLRQGAIRDGGTGTGQWTLQSYLAQVNYAFKDRYLLTANIRADGSSKFGENNRFGFFPSAAFAWRIYEEPFFQPLQKAVSDMKFRVSYGVVGNQEIPGNLAFASFSGASAVPLSNDIGTQGVSTAQLTALSNPDLKWETTAQFNIGTDVSFFDSRLNLTFDYYRKLTSDLLLSTPLPATAPVNSAVRNVGEVENRGFELSLNSINIDNNELKWSTNLNLSRNINEVIALAGDSELELFTANPLNQGNAPIFALQVGSPLGAFYGYRFEGIYQTGDTDIPDGFAPGDPRYADVSGPDGTPDGVIDQLDQEVVGNPNPSLIFGINNTFEYKGFDVSIFFNGELGREMVNYNRIFWETGELTFQRTPNAANAWTTSNPSNEIPRVGFNTPVSSQGTEAMSTRLIEDADFIRLRNLTIGYTIPMKNKTPFSLLRVYLTGQNLLTLTGYSGYDPEANYRSGSATVQGFDFGSYPLQRTFLLGVQAKF